MMSKKTDHKLTSFNYLNWSKTPRIQFLSTSKKDHLTDDSSFDNVKKEWLRDDVKLFSQIRNFIDTKVLSIVYLCEYVKELMKYLVFLNSKKHNLSCMYGVCKEFYRPT